MGKVKRPVKRLDRDRQYDLFKGAPPVSKTTLKKLSPNGRTFQHPDSDDIYLGVTPLKNHLQSVGLKGPLVIKRILDEQDWIHFESAYARTGRAPYSPALMVGLILHGILNKKNSLRELEEFARSDLGAMYVSGGIFPDHSILGRFIQTHAEVLADEFFMQLTRTVLKETHSGISCLAGDGTTIESAGSAYKLLKKEAMEKHLGKKVEAYLADQENPRSAKELERAQQASELLEKRRAARKQNGKSAEGTRISPTDPDACIQPMKKTKARVPCYKPSVLVNETRVITGFAVDPSNEGKVLFEMLTQTKQLSDEEIENILVDAGYHTGDLINEAKETGSNLLCPPGRTDIRRRESKETDKKFTKKDFKYDAQTDTYRCPNGEYLVASQQNKRQRSEPANIVYRTKACASCPLRSQCTTSKKGRMIKRYEHDSAKEELELTMSFPEAKEFYRKRQGMVEPVFGGIKNDQGLMRFRRRGLSNVKTEFSLHVLAYNISRILAYIWLKYLKREGEKLLDTILAGSVCF